jgi:hypothetical protein
MYKKNRGEINMTKKVVVADRFMTLENVKPNKDCNVCDYINDYVCFDHEHQQIKEVYPNCEYTDNCEWVISE